MKNFTQTHLLALMAILFALTLAVGYLTTKRENPSYKLSITETLEQVKLDGAEVGLEELKAKSGQADFIVVDLRDQGEFVKGAIEGAVNIPVSSLMEEESLDLLKDESINFVLYGENPDQAYGPWLILRQMGYQNVKVLAGGYEAWLQQSVYTPEEALYDYAKVMEEERKKMEKEFAESAKPTPPPPPKKKTVIIPQKRKVQEVVEEEGC
jgi:rhodanese-related sulfurtransferase